MDTVSSNAGPDLVGASGSRLFEFSSNPGARVGGCEGSSVKGRHEHGDSAKVRGRGRGKSGRGGDRDGRSTEDEAMGRSNMEIDRDRTQSSCPYGLQRRISGNQQQPITVCASFFQEF